MPMPFNIFLGAVFLKDYQKSGQDRKIIATDIKHPRCFTLLTFFNTRILEFGPLRTTDVSCAIGAT